LMNKPCSTAGTQAISLPHSQDREVGDLRLLKESSRSGEDRN
jgi:hypothetical protein